MLGQYADIICHQLYEEHETTAIESHLHKTQYKRNLSKKKDHINSFHSTNQYVIHGGTCRQFFGRKLHNHLFIYLC